METNFKLIIDSFGKERFKLNQPLKQYSALGVGGPVRLFFIAFKTTELVKLIRLCYELNLPFFIFGTGSKIMISDNGFDGLVIKNRTQDINIISFKGKISKRGYLKSIGIGIEEALIEVDSGVSIGKFIEFLNNQGLETAEFTNLPGSIGGNLFLSKILQSKVKSIKVLTLIGQIEEIEAEELHLKRHVILSAVFKIKAKN